jgi:hypothetical protein
MTTAEIEQTNFTLILLMVKSAKVQISKKMNISIVIVFYLSLEMSLVLMW